MKKRNRGIAFVLALVLTFTSFALDLGGAIVTQADDTTQLALTEEPTDLIDFEKIQLDNIDLSILEEKGFSATQFDKNSSYAVVGADQSVSTYWQSVNANSNNGLKTTAEDADRKATFLNTPYTYENFKVSTEIYWGVNSGIVMGEENVYPRDVSSYSAISVYFANNRIQLGGALDYSTAKVTGTGASWTTYATNTGIFYFTNGFTATKNKVYTLNVEMQDGVLKVWVDGYPGLLTVNVKSHYKTGRIALMNHKYDGDGGAFKSLQVRDLDTHRYNDFNNADVTKLTDFTATQLSKSSKEIVGTADQAVANLWYTGRTGTSDNGTSLPSTNVGLKPKADTNDTYIHLLNYKNTYENFQMATELHYETNMGVIIGQKNTYPASTSSPAINLWFTGTNVAIKGAVDFSNSANGVIGTSASWSPATSATGYGLFKYRDANPNAGEKLTLNVKLQDGILTVWVSGYDAVLTLHVGDAYPDGESNVALWTVNYTSSNPRGFKSFAIKNLNADIDVNFNNVDVTTLSNDFTATQFDKTTTEIVGTVNQPVEKLWYAGRSGEVNGTALTGKTSGIKPKATPTDTYEHLLNYNGTYKNFKLSTEIYFGSNMGIVFGDANMLPEGFNSTAIWLWFTDNGTIGVTGAFDGAKGTATGTDAKWVIQGSGDSAYYLFRYASTANKLTAGEKCTVYMEMKDGVFSVWFSEYDTKLVVPVSANYPDESTVALWSRNYISTSNGFKNFSFEELESGTLEVDKYINFNNIDVTTLTDFTATQLDDATKELIGERNQSVSALWYTGTSAQAADGTALTGRFVGLKPLSAPNKAYDHILHYNGKYENFKVSTEAAFGSDMGITIGDNDVYANAPTSSGIKLWLISNGTIGVVGAFDGTSGQVTGTDAKWVSQDNGNFYLYRYVSQANAPKDGEKITLNVKMQDGVLSIWVSEFDSKLTVNVSGYYPQESTVALWSRNYVTSTSAFRSFAFSELESELTDAELAQAVAGDAFDVDFTESGFAVDDLNEDFYSYYFANANADAERWKSSVLWTMGTKGNNSSNGLKPMHKNENGQNTLLTYAALKFKNVDITAKYLSNYTQYGVMIAPKAKLSTAQTGVKVWVESGGTLKISGAIDAATGSATGGFVRILSNNLVGGYDIDGYKAPNTEYTLRVKVEGKILTAWTEEYPEYRISVQLTEDYQGGMVSVYGTGYQTGGLRSFSATEIEEPSVVSGDDTYTQSFNTITSLEELDDFSAYYLDSVTNTPVQAELSDLFQLSGGRLIANGAAIGEKDRSNHAILTLNNKEYENFELTLVYEQSRMQRYGIMFGTGLGEFAYTQSGSRLASNGGAYVYTEAEGYRNIRGAMYNSFYTNVSEVLHREKGEAKLESFYFNDSLDSAVDKKVLHTMTIRVVDGYMTMLVDNNEASRVTVRLSGYEGGYISLVTDAAASTTRGAFCHLTVKELGEDATLGTEEPEISDGYESLDQIEEIFDAYYLTDLKESNVLQKVDLKEHWWLNNGGFITRTETCEGKYSVTDDVEILTYTKQQYTDFELTYTYQQNWQRLGVIIGGELGKYPLSYKDGTLTADNGALVFLEAEGYLNVKGHLNNMTKKDELLYRVTKMAPEGFRDENGKVDTNISQKKEHTIKIVVKDKQLSIFVDGSNEASLYVYLGDNYKGGYVSLFAYSNNSVGFGSFEITDKVTTELPKGSGVTTTDNTAAVDFDCVKFDESLFTTYYLDSAKQNADGSMTKENFYDQWTLDNGVLESNNTLTSPSSKNLTEFEYDDAAMVSVLTYNEKMTDFIVTYNYQKTPQRMMFMFGTEMGKYALAAANTTEKGQGVIIYPENDLGAGGGIVALGSLDTYYSSMRPLARQKVTLEGYHIAGEWASNVGTWHTMTVAVINNHCYIYLDEYGLIADYELADYNGGHISFATTGRSAGFDNIQITDLSNAKADNVVSVVNPEDITVLEGTELSALALPKTVNVVLKNGTTTTKEVTWIPLHYNGSESGIYQFSAIVDGVTGVAAKLNVKVVKELPKTESGVKYWTFDTMSDLKDFKAAYLKNAETGYITEGTPNWYVNTSGKLTRDAFRAINGTQYNDIAILTYTGETYKNFELEVEYTQQWQRMMVLFGSQEIGQYIDLNDIYAASNPVAGFVEMEGVRNFIGNLTNANFDSNDKEKINNARESGVRLDEYYDKVLSGGNQGKRHTMKIRVVGDKAAMWVDGCETPYVCTLTDYDGGYISLVTTSKNGSFDNLKITRLSDSEALSVQDPDVIANGEYDVTIDTNASTDLVVPDVEKPEEFEPGTEDENANGSGNGNTSGDAQNGEIPVMVYVVGGAVVLLAALFGAMIILLAIRKKLTQKSKTTDL